MQRHITILSFVLVMLLAACGRSVPTRYYLLESAEEPVNADSLPTRSLRVAHVTVPEYLDRNGIICRSAGTTELMISQFHVWAEPVGKGVRRVVQEVLTRPLLTAGITVLAPADEAVGDFVLLVDVQRMDGNFTENAVLEARWMLKNRYSDILAQGIYTDTEPVNDATYDSLVSVESRLVRRMAENLAQHLPRLMREKS